MTVLSHPRSLAQDSRTNQDQINQNNHLSIQHVGQETLVYDERRHLAFCLDQAASAVWTLANGQRSVAQIAAEATLQLARPISEQVVDFALAQLAQDGLMAATDAALVPNHLNQNDPAANVLSRRAMITGLGAGAALLLPVVAVIAAPKAAQAYNGCSACNVVKNSGNAAQPVGVQHATQGSIPTYDPNHAGDNDTADDAKSNPEEQQ